MTTESSMAAQSPAGAVARGLTLLYGVGTAQAGEGERPRPRREGAQADVRVRTLN